MLVDRAIYHLAYCKDHGDDNSIGHRKAVTRKRAPFENKVRQLALLALLLGWILLICGRVWLYARLLHARFAL